MLGLASRFVVASYLRTNVLALENWQQGLAKPNPDAALLIRLVEKYPDALERLPHKRHAIVWLVTWSRRFPDRCK